MEQTDTDGHYTIGAISDRLGISRDTLRFYEKKGIIKPQKHENGYRFYTYEDLRTLKDIIFYRKFDFSIEDIKKILHNSSYGLLTTMVQDKIREEAKLLRYHQRALLQLRITDEIFRKVERHLDNYIVMPMERYYLMGEDLLLGSQELFELCYIHDEYEIGNGHPVHKKHHLFLAASHAHRMKFDSACENRPYLEYDRCVYTITESDSRSPAPESLEKILNWAASQGFTPSGPLYSGYLVGCGEKDRPLYYIELFLPILQGI